MTAVDSPAGVAVGRVGRPWGRRGAFLVEPLTHDLTRFSHLRSVTIGGRGTRDVVEARLDPRGRLVVSLEGVDSIEEAEGFRGELLEVSDAVAVRPQGDAYFNHELLGARVKTRTGVDVGVVEDILQTGAAAILVVRGEEGEVLIPAVRAIVVELDVAARLLTIDPPAGLLELNEPQPDADRHR